MAVPVIVKLQVEGGKVVQGELRGIGDAADGSFRKLETGSRAATQSLRQTEVATGGLRSAISALASVATVAVAADLARRVIEVGDAYQSLRDRIALAAGGMEQGAEAQRRLFQIAQETRQPLADVSDLYAKIGTRAREMGLSMEDQLGIIQMVGQSLALNKTSAAAAAGGLQQFAQMMGGAKVQAEEFNSIIDSMPPLADAMAKGLLGASATVADLKARIEAGLAPEEAVRALLTQLDEVNDRFGTIGKTVADVRTQIENQLFQTTGTIMSTSGATNDLVGGMEKLLATVSDPKFGEGLRWLVGEFVDLLTNLSAGLAESRGQFEQFQALFGEATPAIRGWKQELAGATTEPVPALVALKQAFADAFDYAQGGATTAGQAVRSIGNAVVETSPILDALFGLFRDNAPGAASAVDRITDSILGVSSQAKAAAADLSAFYQAAIAGSKNFAGASGFRGAQDVGTDNEASRAAVAMQNAAFSAPQPPAPIQSPFTPKARPQAEADTAYAAQADKAAKAAERALSEAQKIFARDEAAINDMLRQTYGAIDERGKFIEDAVGKMSEVATDEQIAAMREAAGAAYAKGEMDKYVADQVAHKAQIEQAGAATTREFATATEVFAQRMLELRTQLEAGAISQETYNRAAQAASDQAQQATRDANEATKKNYDETYSEIGQMVDRTYQGISAGLAAMIVKGEADFDTFVEGMAQSLLQSGIQALMTGLIGGGTGGGGLIGMLAGGGGGSPILGIGAGGGMTGGTSTFRSAHGNAFDGGNVIPFARGGIVDRPVVFPMAKGAGLMGEAGPEAVMPLRRLPSGDLGVASAGGAAAPQITITLVNEGRSQLRAEQQAGPDGNLKVMLREIIGAEIGTPGTPGHMATRGVVQRYGSGR